MRLQSSVLPADRRAAPPIVGQKAATCEISFIALSAGQLRHGSAGRPSRFLPR